jgi:hydroxymethylpyrimidine/phosphomethylpyrimidine kinase
MPTPSKDIPALRPVVLAISGLDPTGSAGLLADIRVLSNLGCHPCGVVTCETVQSSAGVESVHPADKSLLAGQLSVLLKDVAPKAVKVGALASIGTITVIADALKKLRKIPIVVDPVFKPTKGPDFLDFECQQELSGKLLPLGLIVTPNVSELGLPAHLEVDPSDDDFIGMMADAWLDLGFPNLLVTGLERDGSMVDRLFRRDSENNLETTDFTHEKHKVGRVHGTGCVLSSAIAAYLAKGAKLEDAIAEAVEFTSRAISQSRKLGKGSMFWAES